MAFTVPAGGEHHALLTDLLPGPYTILRDGKTLRTVTVTPESGVIELPVESGSSYRIVPRKDGGEA